MPRILFTALLVLALLYMLRLAVLAGRGTLIGLAAWVAAVFGLGLLAHRNKAVDRAIGSLFRIYFSFSLQVLLTLVPAAAFSWISRLILDRLPLGLLIVAYTVWGVLLTAALFLISTETRRRDLFKRLSIVGSFTPLAYSFNVLWIAMAFFSSVTFALVRQGVLAFSADVSSIVTPGRVADFYLWHFLNAVPLLQITETLRWTVPLTYEATSIGWLLLLFKLVVIIPVIATFSGYWKYRTQQRESSSGDSSEAHKVG